MLSSIAPNFLHIIASSNTTQSAKSNALKCLKCQVPKCLRALSTQVPKCPSEFPTKLS